MSRRNTIVIGGHAYRWRYILEMRRAQIAAWKWQGRTNRPCPR